LEQSRNYLINKGFTALLGYYVGLFILYGYHCGGHIDHIRDITILLLPKKIKERIEAIEINTEREIYNAKIEFFTNIAHEIRTPLTLIKMPLDKLINKQYQRPGNHRKFEHDEKEHQQAD